MRFGAGACALAGLVAAQTAAAFNYTIGVGRDPVVGPNLGVGFNPSRTVTRGQNDNLVFVFLAGKSSLPTSLENPCTPSSEFDSGLRTIPANVTAFNQSPYQISFTVANQSTVAYFADIGPTSDNSGTQCQQGAVFCVNTNEGGSTSCAQMLQNALALGAQAGVTTSSRPPYTLSTSTSSSATPSRTASVVSTPAPSASAQPTSAASHLDAGIVGAVLAGAIVAAQILL
ncbi:hypothetical protein OIV83_001114 [Microbotryomycetes sp. JL201]|nr:hypothetical protein OIV83_001114 [Microbotryomycetes sp. JL201]